MQINQLSYDLPPERIAQYPPKERDGGRMIVLERDRAADDAIRRQTSAASLTGGDSSSLPWSDAYISDLPSIIPDNALLVFNDSKVRNARFVARYADRDGSVEVLLLESLGDDRRWLVKMERLRRQKVGARYYFPGGLVATFVETRDTRALLYFDTPISERYIAEYGYPPLPPYIKRESERLDVERYQTIYADPLGSTAAPTAGLHFSESLLKRIEQRGIETAFITLHVGMGTFEPIRSNEVDQHEMHPENFSISPQCADTIEAAKKANRPIVAIGTTCVRALETAWKNECGILLRGRQTSEMFIYPPYQFRLVDAIFTNFHAPRTTLLALICAFAGIDRVIGAYNYALKQSYRFLSYGDAMFIR